MKQEAALAYGRLTNQFPRAADAPTYEEDVQTILDEIRRLEGFHIELHVRFQELHDQYERVRAFSLRKDSYKLPE